MDVYITFIRCIAEVKMAYLNTIPQATDQLSVSQGQLLGNFQALNFFGNGIGIFNQQGSDPITSATQLGLYVKLGIDSNPQFFIERELGSLLTPLVYNITGRVASTTGYTQLPSGILIKWGQSNASLLGANVILFPVSATIPVFQTGVAPFQILTTAVKTVVGPSAPGVVSLNGTGPANTDLQFSVFTTVAGTFFNWMAWGLSN